MSNESKRDGPSGPIKTAVDLFNRQKIKPKSFSEAVTVFRAIKNCVCAKDKTIKNYFTNGG